MHLHKNCWKKVLWWLRILQKADDDTPQKKHREPESELEIIQPKKKSEETYHIANFPIEAQ